MSKFCQIDFSISSFILTMRIAIIRSFGGIRMKPFKSVVLRLYVLKN